MLVWFSYFWQTQKNQGDKHAHCQEVSYVQTRPYNSDSQLFSFRDTRKPITVEKQRFLGSVSEI